MLDTHDDHVRYCVGSGREGGGPGECSEATVTRSRHGAYGGAPVTPNPGTRNPIVQAALCQTWRLFWNN